MSEIYSTLKLKSGEMQALVQSERRVSSGITTIFDVVRPTKATPIAKRIEESAKLIIEGGWCTPSKFFIVDTFDVPPDAILPGGILPLEALVNKLSYFNFQPAYCYGFERGKPYDECFAKLIQSNAINKIAFRLTREDLVLIHDTLDRIRAILNNAGRELPYIAAILDLRSLGSSTDEVENICENSSRLLNKIGISNQIIIGSSMWDWSKLEPEKINKVPRMEFPLWESLRRKGLSIKYGDYGVISPQFTEPDSEIIIPAPKVRYCTPGFWLVAKGERPRKGENNQYPRLAQRLMKTNDFRHNDLNWGHEQLKEMASYGFETVGHEKVVAIDTCNHLDIVFRQVQQTERMLELGRHPKIPG